MRKAKQTSTQPAIDLGAELLTSVREMKAGICARVHRPEISRCACTISGRAFNPLSLYCWVFPSARFRIGSKAAANPLARQRPFRRCRAPS